MIMSAQNLLTGGNDGLRRTREDGLERQRGFGAGLGLALFGGRTKLLTFPHPVGSQTGVGSSWLFLRNFCGLIEYRVSPRHLPSGCLSPPSFHVLITATRILVSFVLA